MKHTFKNVVCIVLVAVMMGSSFGCYGSFNLIKKVYKFNGSVGDKWVNELVFLVMNIVPVYGAAGFIDAVILNTIEFWSGSNPVSASMSGDDGSKITFNSTDKTMQIARMIPGKGETVYTVTRENGQSVVKDENNNIVVRCIAGDDGSMTLVDAQGKLLQSYTSTQVQALAMK